ncbi:MAG: hypothetical protein ACOCVF_01050 [bacterium]
MKQEIAYLTNIPNRNKVYGLCKTMMVRKEVIHLKHILTEIFVRKTILIEEMLGVLNLNLFQYMEIITNKLRRVHKISREYEESFNRIIKTSNDSITRQLNLFQQLNGKLVFDFDGVLTDKNFIRLYLYFHDKFNIKTIVCSGNPTITSEWFIKRNLPLPTKIYANKGKIKKIKKLIELSKKNDFLFFIDNETDYLDYAWIFGIKTYHWNGKKIKYYTLKTK